MEVDAIINPPEIELSKTAKQRSIAFKFKLKNYYQEILKEQSNRQARLSQLLDLQKTELDSSTVPPSSLQPHHHRQLLKLGIEESKYLRLKRQTITTNDFISLKTIGKGTYGKIKLVQKKDDGKIYAMKTMRKSQMIKKNQLGHVKSERDLLTNTTKNEWVVGLYYSFQDMVNLYLIMEFLPGGDLMSLLIKYDKFSEDVTRFYIAECVLAINSVHKLGYVHRDIKPDNLLIDQFGHIKLTDFGLSTGFDETHDSNFYMQFKNNFDSNMKQEEEVIRIDKINTWKKNRRKLAYTTVGTHDYVAPEVFGKNGYGKECDWWSLGCILYECLIGYAPFCSNDPRETLFKIINFRHTLLIPEQFYLSPEVENLLVGLLTDASERLQIDQIQAHPFFQGLDWSQLRSMRPPFVPDLKSITDTSYFDVIDVDDEDEEAIGPETLDIVRNPNNDLAFLGYTFKRYEEF